MIRLAFRNLFQSKARLTISVGGVALALLLILALDAIFTGVEQRITIYINNSGADIFVAQSGVRNLHMASSSLPNSVIRRVKGVPGVAAVTPILYLSNNVVLNDERNLAYIIGLPEDAVSGGPWNVSTGQSRPGEGEAIVDRSVAEKAGVSLGDEVKILGQKFEIAGLTEETSSLVNSIAFISMDDFEALRGSYDTFSFLLVQVDVGTQPQAVVARIQAQVRDVTAQTRADFAGQERQVVKDMSTDVITIMNLIGFLIGLAVMALTVYTATLARRAEYGVLKALGVRNRDLYRAVLAQAILSVAFGFAIGLAFTWILAATVPRLGLSMVMEISALSLLKVGSLSLAIAGMAAVLPIRQIAGLDPAIVFRGR
ncbi:MAG: ABC transporter permease [Chloroflexota bacterium]|nr:MAG: ABC transporter permease [Chloroflexota bacterium]